MNAKLQISCLFFACFQALLPADNNKPSQELRVMSATMTITDRNAAENPTSCCKVCCSICCAVHGLCCLVYCCKEDAVIQAQQSAHQNRNTTTTTTTITRNDTQQPTGCWSRFSQSCLTQVFSCFYSK